MSARLTTGSAPSSVALVSSQTVTGAAVQTIDFPGVNLEGVAKYHLFCVMKDTGTSDVVRIVYNADTTMTNYYSQDLQFANGGVGGTRLNSSRLSSMDGTGTTVMCNADIMKIAGAQVFANSSTLHDTTAPENSLIEWNGVGWTGTANVTRIRLMCESGGNRFDVGSKFSLYSYI